MLNANEIADYFIELSTPGTKENITNLKLQKLLYYAQGEYVAHNEESNDEMLFNDRIEAWKHGPVVPEVYRRFSNYIFNEISKTEINKANIIKVKEEELDVFLNGVWSIYGSYNGKQLERMSHMESPWQRTRGELPAYVSSNKEISPQVIKGFFSERE